MSQTEERVVVLEFDNRNFESNTAQSIKTLNQLDNSLKNAGAANGLHKLADSAKKIDLSGLANNVQNVSDRFSTMGIVGMTVIQNLTNSVVDLGKKAVGQMISGGWTRAANIEKAKFQIEGLKGVWDETSKGYVKGMKTIKDAVNNAVDATAYGLDEAAVIGSQLMASGIKDANALESHLKSVSGLAAMTGGSYSDIGRIYAQVAGQGRIMGQQLLQISQRGINVAATMKDYANANTEVRDSLLAAAKASGKNTNAVKDMIARINKGAKLTESDIRELVSTGVVSFEFFSEAMNKAFAEHAKEANKTFDGALANMKAALNRIGAEFATPLRENLRDIFNALTPVINNIKNALMPFINVTVAGGKKVTAAIVSILNLIGKATAPIEKANAAVKKTTKTVKQITGVMTITKREAKAAFDIWNKGTYGNGLARRKALEKEGMSYKHVQGYVNALVKYNFDLDKVHKKIHVSGRKVSKSLTKQAKSSEKAKKETKKLALELKGMRSIEKYRDIERKKGLKVALEEYRTKQKQLAQKRKEKKEQEEEAKRLEVIRGIIIGLKASLAAVKNIAMAVWSVIKTIGVSIKSIFGPIFSTLFDLTKSGGGILLKGLLNITNGIKRLANAGFEKVSSVMKSKVSPAMKDFAERLKEGASRAIHFLSTNKTLQTIFSSLGTIIYKVGSAIGKFFKSVKEYFTNTVQGKKIAVALKNIWEIIKKLASGALERVAEGLERISKVDIKLPDFGDIVSKISSGGGSIFSKLKDFKKNGISGVLKSLFGVDEAHAETKNGALESVKKIANDMKDSGGLLSSASDAINTATSTISKSTSFITKTGSKFTEAFSSFDWDRVLKGGLDVAKIYALVKGVSVVSNLSKGVTELAASIASNVSKFSYITSVIGKNIGVNMKVKVVKDLAVSVGILAASIYVLSKIPAADAYKAVGILVVTMGLLMVVAKMAVRMSASLGRVTLITISFISMSAAMIMLAAAMKMFADMKPGTIAKGIGIIALLIGMFVLAGKALTSIARGGLTFAGMAMAINILVPALIILSKLKPETIAKGGLAIMYLMAELAIASRLARRSAKNAAAMIAMAVAVNLLVPAIIIMSFIPAAKALKGAFVISAVLLSLSLALKAAGTTKLSTLISMTVAITVLCGTLIVLAMLPVEKAIASGAAITAVFSSLAASMYMVSKIKNGAAGILALIAITGSISALFYMLSKLPIKKVVSIGASLSAAVISISSSVAILATIGKGGAGTIKAALIGIAAFDLMILNLIGVLSALGGLSKIPGFNSLIRGGSSVFKIIGDAIGGFVGSIVSGFGKAVASGLPHIGEQLSAFMKSMKPFFEAVESLSPDVGASMKNLAASVLMLTGSSFLDSINIFSGSSKFEKFGTQLKQFIGPFKEFSEEASEMDNKDLESVKMFAKVIFELAEAASEIPNSGGIAGLLLGNNDIDDFAEYVKKAAPNIVEASDSLSLIPDGGFDNLKSFSKCIKRLAEAASEIPNTGFSWVRVFVGQNDLDTFSEYIKTAAPNIAEASRELSGIKPEPLAAIAPIIKEFAKASQEIPNTGMSFARIFSGQNDLDTFAEYINTAAPNIAEAATALTDIPEGGIGRLNKIPPIIKAMAAAADELPSLTFTADSVNDNKLSRFAKYINSAAPDIAAAANSMADADKKGLGKVYDFIKMLIKVSEASVELDPESFSSIIQVLGGGELFGFKVGLGPAIKSFCTSIEGINTEPLVPVSDFIGALAKLAGETGDFDPTAFDGVIQVLGGEGESSKLGKAISTFSASISEIKTEKFKSVSTLINSLVTSANKTEGVSFVGLSDLAGLMPDIGKNIASFASKFGKNVNLKKAKEAATVMNTLSGVVDSFSKFTTVGRKGQSVTSSFDPGAFEEYINSFDKFAEKIKKFAEDMKGVKTGGLNKKAENIKSFIDSVVSSMKKATTKLGKSGGSAIKNFVSGFQINAATKGIFGSFNTVTTNIINQMNLKRFTTAGGTAASKFVTGIKKAKGLKEAGESLFNRVKDGADKSLSGTGGNVGAGFAAGIKSMDNLTAAGRAGVALYNKAKKAIEDASDSQSPSREMMKVGGFIGAGFVIGIENYKKKAYAAGKHITEETIKGSRRDMLSGFSDPVIKPVLDLSDVKKGYDSLGGMFGTTSIKPNLIPNIQNPQNGAKNEDVIDAIHEMSSKVVKSTINNQRGETYNIGDVTLEVNDLKDVLTLDQFVSVIKKAKAFS